MNLIETPPACGLQPLLSLSRCLAYRRTLSILTREVPWSAKKT